MHIEHVQFTAVVAGFDARDKRIRHNLENTLENFNFSYFGVPVQTHLPVNIDLSDLPFIIGQSNDNYSQITVSEKSVQLSIVNDEAVFGNRQGYFTRIKKQVPPIVKILKESGATYLYSGFTARYLFENYDNAVELLNHGSIKVVSGQPFSNFLKKFSIIYGDKYYVNFEFITFRNETSDKYNIGVTIDVNDRYASEITHSCVGYEDSDFILELCEKISDEMIQNLLLSGELNLNE